jgi:hypothetical protein
LCKRSCLEGYVADDETRSEPTTLQSLKASDEEDGLGDGEMVDMAQLPHDKQGFLSKIGHKLAGQGAPPPAPTKGVQQLAPKVQASKKGIANNELGTGYEEDEGTGSEEDIDEIPPTKSGVKPFPDGVYKSFEGSEVGTGYEEGSDGSLSHSVR